VDPKTLPASAIAADRGGGVARPGLVLVFARGTATARVMPLDKGALELGRGDDGPGKLDDGRVSRRHALVACEGGARFMVTDLGSQNGTFADGQLAPAHVPTPVQRVLRVGDSLLIPCADVRPMQRLGVRVIDGFVRGPAMQMLLDEVGLAASVGGILHVRGESGTGKEGVARAFHRAGPRASGHVVAVNCAAIPHQIAERLLFGAKKGAYSGADSDAAGYLQEADGGTLFLDEIGELDPAVQAKLLRAIESKEILPLGAAKARKVDFGFVSATNKDLRALVAAKALREDLYFRVGRPAVTLPPLRNRPEEIAELIAAELAKLSGRPQAHVSLVEQCLLRPWPGNVRELQAELRTAAQSALADGNRVSARHLAATAGSAFGGGAEAARSPAARSETTSERDAAKKRMPQVDDGWRRRIEEALRASNGNIAGTARALGLHRTQLRRLLERHNIAVTDPDDKE
jgi:transcriptional regulator with GAF, ATPase, and Fis domain